MSVSRDGGTTRAYTTWRRITFNSACTRRSSALHRPRSTSRACSFLITFLIVLSMSLTWFAFSANRRFICRKLNNKLTTLKISFFLFKPVVSVSANQSNLCSTKIVHENETRSMSQTSQSLSLTCTWHRWVNYISNNSEQHDRLSAALCRGIVEQRCFTPIS